MIALYPGSFDPATIGHLDVIKRASLISDKLLVAVLHNANKATAFTLDERVEMLKRLTHKLKNVEVISFSGLLADLFVKCKANAIIRGVRTISDYERELVYASANRSINEKIESLFIPADPAYLHISSTIVKEAAYFGGDVSKMVSPEIIGDVKKKFAVKDQRED
ncbi:MAG: pantetheine-phosphate adenylyltransferase [Clostridiales bacterium]|jgi:pantetheine-phosphate adenylyltransferase|nr:pantetheine-phosphate adenylyltransferase [Clostridiales bacterium]